MRSIAITILLAALSVAGGQARASDTATLFHAVDTTYGCADPYATRTLTGPDRPSAATVRTTFSRGRCVTITPKSPWRLISRDNDVALMEYAGDVGQPGSYYLRVDQLVGPNGDHPGDLPPPASTASGPALVNSASETALAPDHTPGPAGMAPPALTGAGAEPHPMWGVSEILLLLIALGIAVTGGYVLGRRSARA